MRLVAHVPGAEPWIIDPEFPLGYSLEEAFREAAEQTSADAGSELLDEGTDEERAELSKLMQDQMTADLRHVGDRYCAPDGTIYTLED